MRLSRESQELADLEYIKVAQKISDKHRNAVRQFEQTMPRGGAMRGAIDKEYIQMARDLVQSRTSIYIEALRRENLTPDESDVIQICAKLKKIVRSISLNSHHPPLPSSQEGYRSIVPSARMELIIAMKKMQLEQRQSEAPVSNKGQASPNGSLENARRELSGLTKQEELKSSVEPDTSAGRGKLSVNDMDLFELKPNIFGIGLNLNHLIKRVVISWRNRSKNKNSA